MRCVDDQKNVKKVHRESRRLDKGWRIIRTKGGREKYCLKLLHLPRWYRGAPRSHVACVPVIHHGRGLGLVLIGSPVGSRGMVIGLRWAGTRGRWCRD